MNTQDLIRAIHRLKVETGSLTCFGCGYEHSCSVRGCAILRSAAAALKKKQWIDVKDRLPATDEAVLVIASGNPMPNITFDGAYVLASYFSEDGWIINEYPEWEAANVTHWMPLPDPPKEG